ncbi:TrmH family RNA methyltransferase [Oxalobacter paraformigenes]|uniref:tRNA/rRNA methyltransferase SpoU type domain-containing protein n=1 Tax=Oxalobacter paraformigenes TaxID=556268 RepID=C3X4L3_9BURK|nr:RNA methyltransferase [Oxalobacter paraformigenes]EEO28149.1 hypothetical protein OFAG_01302 [Oxalobacter paraformigenes]
MKLLTSRDNPQYRKLRQLASNSAASRKGEYAILDGIHLCQAYLGHVGIPVLCVASQTSQHHPEVSAIVQECKSGGAKCLLLTDSLYRPISQVENGVDIVFVISKPAVQTCPVLRQTAVLLDRIQDPGNLGSILRSAAAAGIARVFCSAGTASAWSPRVLRAGMGAHFLLEIVENVVLEDVMEASEIPVIATTPYTETTIYDCDLRLPVAWLLGHEGKGIRESLLDKASDRVVVPHQGAMESLNVAACAAVCFFEQVRQNRVCSGGNRPLPD